MKKNILFLIVITLLSKYAVSQNSYTIEKDSYLFDLPGGDFMTAILKNNKTHLKHYGSSGNIIWSDSLDFYSVQNSLHFHSIARFEGTEDYVISMYNETSPFFIDYGVNDTLVFQFTRFNLPTHQFTYNLIDTFYTRGGQIMSFSDTSIYLFLTDLSYDDGGQIGLNTYSLNSQFVLSQISSSSAVHILDGWSTQFFKFDDKVFLHQNTSEFNYLTHFNSSMTQLSSNNYSVELASDFEYVQFKRQFSNDSVLIVSEGSDPGSFNRKWKLEWLDNNFTPLSSQLFDAPLTPTPPLKYTIANYGVEVDEINNLIFILATDINSIGGLYEDEQQLFIYDFAFNLICEIPVSLGSKYINSLIKLNDQVFLKVNNQSNIVLFPLGCQMMSSPTLLENNELLIYPNPSNGFFTIKYSNLDLSKLEFKVYDITGQKVAAVKCLAESNSEQIDLRFLNKGIYIVQGNLNGQFIESQKIIVE
jgi:hypothetical protein